MINPISRRRVLLGLGGTALAPRAFSPSAFASTAESGLAALAAKSSRTFGSCSAGLIHWAEGAPVLGADPAYVRLLLDNCRVLTTERELKMSRLRPTPTHWEWRPVDLLAGFARDNGLLLRGHTLVWHESMPDWWEAQIPPEKAEAALIDHISAVCARMGDQVISWDVVNEPVATDGGSVDGYRNTPLFRQLGPGYIDLAFRAANQAAPKARLCLNEFGIEYDTRQDAAKRRALLALLRRLLDAGVPVHMVGLQAHLQPRKHRFDPELFAGFLAQLRRMGLAILVTELDCIDRHLPAIPYLRDRAIAQGVRDFLDVVLAEPAVEGVVCWGLSDRYSWLSEAEGTRRRDGLRSRGAVFDEALRPKAMHGAMSDALKRAKARALSL